MALAVINKAPPVIQPPTTVTLTLSLDEAEVLRFITGKVKGPPVDSPRELTDSIYAALDAAGIRITDSYSKQNQAQSIRFI